MIYKKGIEVYHSEHGYGEVTENNKKEVIFAYNHGRKIVTLSKVVIRAAAKCEKEAQKLKVAAEAAARQEILERNKVAYERWVAIDFPQAVAKNPYWLGDLLMAYPVC